MKNMANATGEFTAIKREILKSLVSVGEQSITDISHDINLSVPTVTKFLGELIEEGYVIDNGKNKMTGGRRPNIYGLDAGVGYFVGVDVIRDMLRIGVMDFKGEMLATDAMSFTPVNTSESVGELCGIIESFLTQNSMLMEHVLSASVSISGRVDSAAGFSYTMYSFGEEPIADIMTSKLGVRVYIENDSRAMVYGEYLCGSGRGEQTFIFVNLSWGFGIGMMIDGKLFYGKSGLSGEYGHLPSTQNEILCQCGKRGCLETAVSGWATRRMVIEKLNEGRASSLAEKYKQTGDISLIDIMDAACYEDTLAIEVIAIIGEELGRAVSGLINIFNPETIVIGGGMISVKDYLMLSLRSAIQKYSLRMVSRDTNVRVSTLGENAALIGACMLARSKMLGIL